MLYTSDTVDRCATTLPGRNGTSFRSEVHRLQNFEAKKILTVKLRRVAAVGWVESWVRGLALRDPRSSRGRQR